MAVLSYMVVSRNNLIHLENKVNELIEAGWVPQGGVHATVDLELLVWAQAMVINKPS